ncbi:MAG: DUF167 domain-containing protein [candidate division WOR-3 bacterium]|jgi:hypothetical protein
MRISVIVKPNSKQNKVEKIEENKLIVYLKEPPKENRANVELIEILSEYFKVPKSKISIIRGLTGRQKIIEIKDLR